MIESAGQAGVARLGSDRLMWFSPALDRAFENTGCMAAILLERIKNRLYESSQSLLQPRLVRWREAINSGGVAIRLNIIILMPNLSV